MAKNMLVADDLLNPTAYSRQRSELLQNYAAELAEQLNGQIKYLYVKDPGHGQEKALDEKSQVEGVHDFFEKKGIRVSVFGKVGNPVEEILKAQETPPKPSLIVMGTHGKTGLDRLFLGSVAEEVIRNSCTPVLILGPQITEAPRVVKSGKILVATDLTKNSRRAEAYAMKLAAALKAEIVLIHSIAETVRTADQFASMSGTAYIDDSFIKTMRQKAGQALKKKAQLLKSKRLRASFILDEKGPISSHVIAGEALKDYQFLIMGTHGRNSLVSAFLGSTARQTLLSAPLPTIIVKSDDFMRSHVQVVVYEICV